MLRLRKAGSVTVVVVVLRCQGGTVVAISEIPIPHTGCVLLLPSFLLLQSSSWSFFIAFVSLFTPLPHTHIYFCPLTIDPARNKKSPHGVP